MLEIDKADKQELFTLTDDSGGTTELRQRGTSKTTRSNLVSQQESVTERMLSISRHLSDTTQRSAETLENLVASSSNIEDTQDELQNTAGTILQSGKLLQKYGRRECTDKILLFFAFAFFLACVIYIVQKRLF
jgi:protein transport protein SEC20